MIVHMPEHLFRNRIVWLIKRKGRKILTCTETRPCNFSVSPRIAERSVDFPAPTWPTIAIRAPLGILSEILKHKTDTLHLTKHSTPALGKKTWFVETTPLELDYNVSHEVIENTEQANSSSLSTYFMISVTEWCKSADLCSNVNMP